MSGLWGFALGVTATMFIYYLGQALGRTCT